MRLLLNIVLDVASGRGFLARLIAYGIYMPIFFYAPTPFRIGAIRPYAGGASILDVEPLLPLPTLKSAQLLQKSIKVVQSGG